MPDALVAPSLLAHLQPLLPSYLEDLRQLCAIESPSDHKVGVDAAGAWVAAWAEAHGCESLQWPDERAGDGVTVSLRGAGKLRVMLVAHLDTVYDLGVVPARPQRLEGDKLIGPGVADNKGGLLSGLYALTALRDLDLIERFHTVSVVCGGDEETNMRASEAMLGELAPDYDLALVLEPGRPNGDIVSARKGIANYVLEAHGKPAHAGVEPERGANAILALAHQILALQTLNGTRPGLTVNCGVVTGGTRTNVVSEYARVEVDVRVVRPEDMEPVEQEIRDIASRAWVPGVHSTLSGGWHFGPMARTPTVAELVALASECAEELGFSIADVATGGGSYANPLSSLSLPVLDGLGPTGGHLHSPDEYILRPSIMPRVALLAMIMLRRVEKT